MMIDSSSSSSYAPAVNGWAIDVNDDRDNYREGSEHDDFDQASKNERRLANLETKRIGLTIKAHKVEEDIIRANQRYENEERRIKEAIERHDMKYRARQMYLNEKLQVADANAKKVLEEHEIRRKYDFDQKKFAKEQAERDKASIQRLEQMICNLYFQPLDSPASIQLKLQQLEEDQRTALAFEDSLYVKLVSDDDARKRRIWKEIKYKIDSHSSLRAESNDFVATNGIVWEKILNEEGGWMKYVPEEARLLYTSVHREFEPYERRPSYNCSGNDGSSSINRSPSCMNLKKKPVSQEIADRIKQDAYRTFSNFGQHSQTAVFLITRRESQCVEALSNLLLNAAQYFGYCQGMSYIAANFLLYNTEIDSFILFCYLMHEKNLRVLFDPNSSCLVYYIKELEHWLKYHCQELYDHFKDIGFTGYCYAIQWFNTCHLASNPGNLSRCVVDMLMIGVKDTLLRVGVSILENVQSQLVHLDLDQTQEKFKFSVAGVRTIDVLYKALSLFPPHASQQNSLSVVSSSEDFEIELLKRLDPATCVYQDEVDKDVMGDDEDDRVQVQEFDKNYGEEGTKRNECTENSQLNTMIVNTVYIDKVEQAVVDFEKELDRLYEEQTKAKANQNANQYLRQLLADSRNGNTSDDSIVKGRYTNSRNILFEIPLKKRFSMQSIGSILPIISPQDKFEAIKLYDKGFTRAMILIERVILGVVARKKLRKELAKFPHIVTITINKACDLQQDDLSRLGGSIGVYITIVGIDSNGKCCSRKQTSVGYSHKNTIRWPENEQHLICMDGTNGHIVLNVFTHSLFTSERFLGQVVLDMKDRQQLVDGLSPYFDVSEVAKRFLYGDNFIVRPSILRTANFPSYDKIGCEYETIVSKDMLTDNSSLKLTLSLPSIFSSLCGTFYEKCNSLFGIVEIKKVWVIVHKNLLLVFNNRFENRDEMINSVSLFDISHLDDYHEKESVAVDPMSVDGISKDGMSRDGICFGVKRTDNMGLVYQKEFIWLWTEDTCSLKGLWKRILTRHCCC